MQEIDVALSLISCLSLREKLLLRNRLDSLDALSVLSIEDISRSVSRAVTPGFWDGARLSHDARLACRIARSMGIRAVLYEEGEYPALLRETVNAPYMLFFRGRIASLHERCVSVVGTRSVCEEGARAARDFSHDAALDGRTVVSGLAMGIDSFAHAGALSAPGGCTVAVLPCGIDQVVPRSNTRLAGRILSAGGCLVSEYAPGIPVEKWRFVQRNRIIAALSPQTVVIQAPPGSGALITADFAVDFDRDVLVHAACLSGAARSVPPRARKGGASEKRTVASLVEAGAPVIRDYADMVSVLEDAPGSHALNLQEVEYGCKGNEG